MQQILITDTLFIFPEHEEKLRNAGYEVVRMKGDMNEAELCEAIKGKTGYILGGVERVTDKVIESADVLRAIAFTGADWANFIPGRETARKKGIVITNTPGSTTNTVSEFAIALTLAMLRHTFELGGPGDKTFMTTQSLPDCTVGIVGLGRIGERVARMFIALGAKEVVYWSRTRRADLEKELGIHYLELNDLLKRSDVISNHVSSEAGIVFAHEQLSITKEGVLIINTGGATNFDMDALYDRIASHGARAAFDLHGGVQDERFKKLPLASWYSTNENTAYNTLECLRTSSDMAVESLLNVLQTGKDQYIVNQ